MEEILLVDEQDNPKGYIEKIAAHENKGILHRAFSVFIYNEQGEMLLQKRAEQKYHFPGLWTNTCCGHQSRKDKAIIDAAHRRLKEEFGFDAKLTNIFNMTYHANSSNNLSEFEYDHIFIGLFQGKPEPNPMEISKFKWIKLGELEKEILENRESYTPWFRMALKEKENFLLNYENISEILK